MKNKLQKQEWLSIISDFISYCLEQDKLFVSLPKLPAYDGQSQLRHELKMKWVSLEATAEIEEDLV